MNGHDDEMNKRMNPAMDSKNIGHQKFNRALDLIMLTVMIFLKIID